MFIQGFVQLLKLNNCTKSCIKCLFKWDSIELTNSATTRELAIASVMVLPPSPSLHLQSDYKAPPTVAELLCLSVLREILAWLMRER